MIGDNRSVFQLNWLKSISANPYLIRTSFSRQPRSSPIARTALKTTQVSDYVR